MPTRKWHLLVLAFPPALLAAMPAQAQSRRSDADAYPCDAKRQLEIVQRGAEFSIEPVAAPRPEKMPALPAVIAVGRTLGLDRKILEKLSARPMEVSDAPHP